jgi:hypothetical protein
VDYVQLTLLGKLPSQMTTIEIKQNELDAKVASMSNSNKFKPKLSMILKICFLLF